MSDVYNQSTEFLDADNVNYGNCKASISAYSSSISYSYIGGLVDVSYKRERPKTKNQVDNAPADYRIIKESCTINITQLETLNLAIAEMMIGDSDTYTAATGDEVENDTWTIAADSWTSRVGYEIPGQNATGAIPTIGSVLGDGVTGTAGSVDDDYRLEKHGDGKWYMSFDSGGTNSFATDAYIVVTYTYTPAARTDIDWGTSTTLTNFILRLEMANRGRTTTTIVFHKCQLQDTGAIALPADDSEDPIVKRPLVILAEPDVLYKDGYVARETITPTT